MICALLFAYAAIAVLAFFAFQPFSGLSRWSWLRALFLAACWPIVLFILAILLIVLTVLHRGGLLR